MPDPLTSSYPQHEGIEILAAEVKAACDTVPISEPLPRTVIDAWFRFTNVAIPAARTDLISGVGNYIIAGREDSPVTSNEDLLTVAAVISMAHLLAYHQRGDVKDLQTALRTAERLRRLAGDESRFTRLAMMIERIARGWAGLPMSSAVSSSGRLGTSSSDFDAIVERLDMAISENPDEDQIRAEISNLDSQVSNASGHRLRTLRETRAILLFRLYRMSGSDNDRRAALADTAKNVEESSPGTWEYASSRLRLVEGLNLSLGIDSEDRYKAIRELLFQVIVDQEGWSLPRINAASQLIDYCLPNESDPMRWLMVTLAGFVALQAGSKFVALSGAGAELVLDRIQGLSRRAAYAALKAEKSEEAIQLLEWGSGLLSAKRLELQFSAPPEHSPAGARSHNILKQLETLADSIRNQWSDTWGSSASPQSQQQELKAWSDLSTSLKQWNAANENARIAFGADITGRFMPDQVRTLAAETQSTVIYVASAQGEGFALLVSADTGPEVKWLPDLSEESVLSWAAKLSSAFDESVDYDVFYRELIIDEIVSAIADALDTLPSGHLLLIPTGHLNNLPLQAALHGRGDRTVSVAVNARMHDVAFRRSQNMDAVMMLAVADPSPCTGREHKLSMLPRAAREVQNLAARGGLALTGRKACKALVIEHTRTPLLVLHLALHGVSDPERPYMSRMFLADDEHGFAEELTVGELRPQARMAVLSSCWLGSAGRRLPDEAQGFPSAFMEAGCAGVISALWPVGDMAAEEMMNCFYTEWLEKGHQPAAAFAIAQARVRIHFPITDAAAWQLTGY
jgi:CHAT domain-containing protein